MYRKNVSQRDQQVAQDLLLQAAQAAEKVLDEQLEQLDNMGDDDLMALRAKRLKELKEKDQKRRQWQDNGHGKLNDLADEKEFFEDVKRSKLMVVHFFRPGTKFCDVVDQHLSKIAAKHLETKFMRINVEKAPFLVDRLKIWMLPTIMIIKDGKTEHSIVGLDELGSNGRFKTEKLESVLADWDVITLEEDLKF